MSLPRKIILRCTVCKCTMRVARLPQDPAVATEIRIRCPSCDNGDFEAPTYINAKGEPLHNEEKE